MGGRKILFTDLDGTLLSTDKSISKKNRKAIQDALAAGHYVTVATGRPVESARYVVKDLGLTLPGCYMIAFNGAVLYDSAADHILLERKIPADCVQRIFEAAEEAGIYVQTYTNREVLTRVHGRELDYYCRNTGMSYKIAADILGTLQEEPNKILLADLDDKKKLEKFQQDNRHWTQENTMTFFSCDQYLEYCPKDTHKGTGISYLCDFLNIPLHDTIAVGDERNDIPMLQAAGIGIAMKNANEEVKKHADCVSEHDNNHDAIAEIIEKYIL